MAEMPHSMQEKHVEKRMYKFSLPITVKTLAKTKSLVDLALKSRHAGGTSTLAEADQVPVLVPTE